ncbi:MAG: ACP S-malonyltransferase [Treponema sp.]|nr:ACP S-malonyltransferase [Treponema sp.]
MKTFFLFPGQGAQFPGMAIDLLNAGKDIKNLFDIASQASGKDMKDILANSDAETLKRTDISQPAITLASLAAAAYLGEKGIKPDACAGFSLGEYPALAVSGIISSEDCMFLVTKRGKAMQDAIDHIKANGEAPGMMAVMGLAPDKVESLITEWNKQGLTDLYAANINSSKQVAVSGSAAALADAEKRFTEAGARRVIRLAVAGPFHSPFMKEAVEIFKPDLEKIKFRDPAVPVFSNVTGKQIKTGEEAKMLAIWQMERPVRWTDEEMALATMQPDLLIETGPGKVLQGLWKDTGSTVTCMGGGTAADIENLINYRSGHEAGK